MSDQRKGIPYLKVFGDWLVRFQKLDDAQFGRLIRAAIGYVCAGEEPDIDGMEGLSFDYIRPALDNDMVKYAEKVHRNTKNGQKGAAARWGADSERHAENGERHTPDSERHTTDGENSQEKREKKEESKIQDSKIENSKSVDATGESDSDYEALSTAWDHYCEMRDRINPFSDGTEIGTVLEQLQTIGNHDPKTMARILEQAIKDKRAELLPLSQGGVQGIVSRIASGCSI